MQRHLHPICLLLILLVGCTAMTPVQPTLEELSAEETGSQAAPIVRDSSDSNAIAMLTYVAGDIFVDASTVQQRSIGLMRPTGAEIRATAFQELQEGSTIRAAADATATIVCYDAHAYQVAAGTYGTINAAACGSGYPLPAGSVPYAPRGRLLDPNGSVVIEGETRERETDYGQLPIIVSPRNSTLFTDEPMLVWVEVNDAMEYVFMLSGLTSFADVTISADAMQCEADERTKPNRICRAPWPVAWQLTPAQRYFLTVAARTGIAAPLRESEVSSLRTLAIADRETLQATIATIDALTLDSVTLNLLRAEHFLAAGLSAQTIAAYEAAYTIQPTPIVAIALGDLYLEADLQRFAIRAYQGALALVAEEGDPTIQAAAEYGIGLVYFRRGNYAQADIHLSTALTLYQGTDAEEERASVETALHATRERL